MALSGVENTQNFVRQMYEFPVPVGLNVETLQAWKSVVIKFDVFFIKF